MDKRASNVVNVSPTQSEQMPRMGDTSSTLNVHLPICSLYPLMVESYLSYETNVMSNIGHKLAATTYLNTNFCLRPIL